MDRRADRGENPPLDNTQIAVVTVPESGTLTVRFLGPILGILTHWFGGRSVACNGEGTCDPKYHKCRTTWKGYVAVEYVAATRPPTMRPAVLEVTENLYEYIGTDNPRGQVWQLLRAKCGKGRVECRGHRLIEYDRTPCRTDVRVEPAVQRLYRSLEVAFGQVPPFGSRQVLGCSPVPAELIPSPSATAKETAEDAARAVQMLRAERAKQKQDPAANANGNGKH